MSLTLALELFSFTHKFSRLQESDRLLFLPFSQKHYCHIFLRRVNNPARGPYNKISFVSAELANIDDLPENYREGIRARLCERFPSICIGYTVSDPSDNSPQKITTITHPFSWPPPSVKGLGIQKVTRLIILVEWILQMEMRVLDAKKKADEAAA